MSTASQLETLQTSAVSLIGNIDVLADVPCLYERMKNVSREITKAINTLKGIAMVVLTPVGRNTTPGAPVVNLDVKLVVEIAELVIINNGANGTGIAASYCGEQVCAHLQHKPWKEGKTLVCEELRLRPHKTYVVYRAVFGTGVQLEALTE